MLAARAFSARPGVRKPVRLRGSEGVLQGRGETALELDGSRPTASEEIEETK
jgi:hypothetical protein